MKTISVVTPCYNEEANIRDCYETVRQIFARDLSGHAREHIFCDNASTDGTLGLLKDIAASDPCVKVIRQCAQFRPSAQHL